MRFLADIKSDMDRFAQRKGEMFAPARALVSQLAKQAKAEAKAALRGGRSGKRYGGGLDKSNWKLTKVAGKKPRKISQRTAIRFKAYTASAPGEAPANRTGQMLRSIRAARVKGKRGLDAGFTFFVFADRRTAFYQRFLEFGSRRRNIKQRPLFTPLVSKYQGRLRAELPAALQRGFDAAAGR